MEQETTPTQNIQNTLQSPQNVQNAFLQKREAELEKKKKKFFRRLWFFGLLGVALLAGATFLKHTLTKLKVGFTVEETPLKAVEDTSSIDDSQGTYKSDLFKLALSYPKDTTVTEKEVSGDDPPKVEINSNANVEKEANLVDGYIFRVTLLDLPNLSLDETTKAKKVALQSRCPTTATFSETKGTDVNSVDARTFEVSNCGPDYKFTYVPKFGQYYEFAQIYAGGIGIKQQYRRATDAMLQSVTFDPEEGVSAPPPLYITFSNLKPKFSFEHPRLNATCCEIPGPLHNTAYRLAVLADESTVKDSKNFDGLGVFLEKGKADTYKGSFDSYVYEHETVLADEYKVVTGKTPSAQKIELNVGGRYAIMLKGYSWQGNDLIFVDLPEQQSYDNYYLVISVNNRSGNFDETLNRILESFRF